VPSVIDPALKSMLCDLENMLSESDAYDEDFIRPNETAFRRAHDFLMGSADLLSVACPLGSVFPDGDGGIRVEWRARQRHVRLIVPASADKAHYVYYQDGEYYDGEDDVAPSRLAYYLTWLIDETVPTVRLQPHRLPSYSQ
jgi:hypothetical protein